MTLKKESPHRAENAVKANIKTCIDIVADFTAAMSANGIETTGLIVPDGLLHRFHIDGHRYGSKNGAYILHGDSHPAGWFQDFRSGITGTWSSGGGAWKSMDEATRRAIQEAKRLRQVEFDARYERAAIIARELWASSLCCESHLYLERKGVAAHGLRQATWSKWLGEPGAWREIVIPGALLIPLRDEVGTIWNLQAIFDERHPELGRDKDFLSGRKSGLFHEIGNATATVFIAEGYATGASIYAMSEKKTFVAFDCGNLKPVARTVRQMYPDAEIIICADDDRNTPGNPGLTKAKEAALAVHGKVSVPPFQSGSTGTDWNDYEKESRHGL